LATRTLENIGAEGYQRPEGLGIVAAKCGSMPTSEQPRTYPGTPEPWPRAGGAPRRPSNGSHLFRFLIAYAALTFLPTLGAHALANVITPAPPELERVQPDAAIRAAQLSRADDYFSDRRVLEIAGVEPPDSREELKRVYGITVRYGDAIRRTRIATTVPIGGVVTIVFVMALPRIGYRKRDFLLLFIPLYGCIVSVKFLWRLVSPVPYWT
jgi:hypothetical protein